MDFIIVEESNWVEEEFIIAIKTKSLLITDHLYLSFLFVVNKNFTVNPPISLPKNP